MSDSFMRLMGGLHSALAHAEGRSPADVRPSEPEKPRATVPLLSDAEEAAIQAGIAQDPDAAEATDEQLSRMRPASEVLPPALFKALTKGRVGDPDAE